MSFNWTSESLVAAAAVILAMLGGAGAVAVEWGSVNTIVATVQAHAIDQDKKIDSHDDRIRTQENNSSAEKQSLADIKEQLDRIEKKL